VIHVPPIVCLAREARAKPLRPFRIRGPMALPPMGVTRQV
jgi:hypothetical protein